MHSSAFLGFNTSCKWKFAAHISLVQTVICFKFSKGTISCFQVDLLAIQKQNHKTPLFQANRITLAIQPKTKILFVLSPADVGRKTHHLTFLLASVQKTAFRQRHFMFFCFQNITFDSRHSACHKEREEEKERTFPTNSSTLWMHFFIFPSWFVFSIAYPHPRWH